MGVGEELVQYRGVAEVAEMEVGPFPTLEGQCLRLQRPAGAALGLPPRPSPSATPTSPTPALRP